LRRERRSRLHVPDQHLLGVAERLHVLEVVGVDLDPDALYPCVPDLGDE